MSLSVMVQALRNIGTRTENPPPPVARRTHEPKPEQFNVLGQLQSLANSELRSLDELTDRSGLWRTRGVAAYLKYFCGGRQIDTDMEPIRQEFKRNLAALMALDIAINQAISPVRERLLDPCGLQSNADGTKRSPHADKSHRDQVATALETLRSVHDDQLRIKWQPAQAGEIPLTTGNHRAVTRDGAETIDLRTVRGFDHSRREAWTRTWELQSALRKRIEMLDELSKESQV